MLRSGSGQKLRSDSSNPTSPKGCDPSRIVCQIVRTLSHSLGLFELHSKPWKCPTHLGLSVPQTVPFAQTPCQTHALSTPPASSRDSIAALVATRSATIYTTASFSQMHALKMSPEGQVWVTDTMLCLQRALVPYGKGREPTTCEAVKEYAFGTHPSCYINSGVFTLPPSDWPINVNTVGLLDLFSSWMHSRQRWRPRGFAVRSMRD
jgi:hypothetical protein